MGVLPPDVVHVLVVPFPVRREDREVRVAEHLPREVVGFGAVLVGEADEPRDLLDERPGYAGRGQRALGQRGGPLLVVGPPVVHRVVEPRREDHCVPVDPCRLRQGEQVLEPVEHLRQVAHVVVATMVRGVARDEALPQGRVVRQPGGPVPLEIGHRASLASRAQRPSEAVVVPVKMESWTRPLAHTSTMPA